MKSIFSIVILSLSVLVASAQLGPGSWYTGACAQYSYASSGNGTSKTNQFLIYPATYYSLNEHLGVGGELSYGMATTKDPSSNKTIISNYAIEPGIRYYGKITDKVNCYFQSNLNFGGGTTKYESSGSTSKINNTNYGLSASPGLMWNVKSNVYLDFHYGNLEYLHTTSKEKDTGIKSNDNSLLFNLNPWSVGVGLFYNFGGTK